MLCKHRPQLTCVLKANLIIILVTKALIPRRKKNVQKNTMKDKENAKYTMETKRLEVQKPNVSLSAFITATHLAFGYNK